MGASSKACVGGDYDVIAKVDSSLCPWRSSLLPEADIRKEISAFFDSFRPPPDIGYSLWIRVEDEGQIVPMFEDEIKRRSSHELSSFLAIQVSSGTSSSGAHGRELFQIQTKSL